MFTQEQLEQLAKVIDTRLDGKLQPIKDEQEKQGQKLDTIASRLSTVEKTVETLELNVEILRSESKKAHTEIIEQLVTSNEINGKQLKEVENRVTQLEAESAVPKSH